MIASIAASDSLVLIQVQKSSSVPTRPAPAPSHFQKTASLLFKDYNLKMINKRIGAKLLQFVHAIINGHIKKIRNIDYSIFVSIFIFVPSKIKTL